MSSLGVTVVIPVFNGEAWVADAIHSVLAQRTPREVVVVDDGSTDDTQSVLGSFGDEIVLVRQPNRGVSAARNAGIEAATKLLDQSDPPTAIFASNDDMAAATVAMALRRHLDVPADLTVCGFDDTAIASTVWPELTTIRQPIQEISRRALELLANELKAVRAGRSPKPTHITLDYSLVKRQSHAAPGLARGAARKRLTR